MLLSISFEFYYNRKSSQDFLLLFKISKNVILNQSLCSQNNIGNCCGTKIGRRHNYERNNYNLPAQLPEYLQLLSYRDSREAQQRDFCGIGFAQDVYLIPEFLRQGKEEYKEIACSVKLDVLK